MNKFKLFIKSHWRFTIAFLISLSGTVLILTFAFLSRSNQILEIGAISLLTLGVLNYLLFSKSNIFDEATSAIRKRDKLVALFLAIIFSSILVAVFAIQETQNMQEQINIANRDTAPSPTITTETSEEGTTYTITNEKGLILYSSLTVDEEYYFMVNSRGHQITFNFFGEPKDNTTTLDTDKKSISFFVPSHKYDSSETASELEEAITSQAGATPILSRTRKVVFHFFDYQNESRTFTYREDEEGITLQSTESEFTGPRRNSGYAITNDNEVIDLIPDAVRQVLTMNPDQSTIEY